MDNWTIILLGATGDLSKRKIIPALYSGIKKGATHASRVTLIGVAYEDRTETQMLEQAEPFIKDFDQALFERMSKQSSYCQIDFNRPEDYIKLAQHIAEHEKNNSQSNKHVSKRLVYCAISPDFFIQVTEGLVTAGILEKDNNNHRIAYEKPFGHDLESARSMNRSLQGLLDRDQIYRIDHYLTKELVNTIVAVRFTNTILERVWDSKSVERVEIFIDETVSAEGRHFFDEYGALKDVVQNHLLQLLALTAMERPDNITFEQMSEKKAKLLQNVRVEKAVFGQYDGYRSEPGVTPNSKTNTFVALKLFIDVPRWKDVPFYVRTGKCLDQRKAEIRIVYKQVGECFLDTPNACTGNVFTIRIQPDEGIALQLNAREPHDCTDELCRVSRFGLLPVSLDFCHSCLFGPYAPQAYEILLQSIIAGDTEIDVSAAEIEAQWSIVEQVQKLQPELYEYAKGSSGPKQAYKL